jgi:TnpA family transposase
MWTHDAYIREDTYRAALAKIINAHHRLPFSQVWGSGTTSSSDGQFFRGAKRGASGGDINARYGVDFGFSFYTHNSNQRAPYHVNVISAATHEAPYVLDGLINHGTDLKISEHYTDTGGATDHVFALCAMLGRLLLVAQLLRHLMRRCCDRNNQAIHRKPRKMSLIPSFKEGVAA